MDGVRFLSVCSGIDAASVAWDPLGWEPLAFSEISAFPRAVLAHHYPDVPLHGDFTALRDEPWIVDADVLVGGTPCQAFSVAGCRGSLADERGNLALEFVRLADAIDVRRRAVGRQQCWVLWENVPGVFSTADNAFGAFLGGLVGSDAAIVPSGGRWTRAGVAVGPGRVAAWRVLDAQHFGLAQRRERVFVLALGGARAWAAADALLPLIESRGGHPAPSRQARDGHPGEIGGGASAYGGNRSVGERDVAAALTAHGGSHGRLDFESETFVVNARQDPISSVDMAQPLDTDGGSQAVHDAGASGVRRLTPREWERLQGFPDDYTSIPWRGRALEECPDGPRYQALGNSMPVPVMRYIGRQMESAAAAWAARCAA